MTRKYFVGISEIRSDADADHLIEAARQIKLDPEAGLGFGELVIVMDARDLTPHGYGTVREFVRVMGEQDIMITAIIKSDVVSLPVICSLAKVDALMLKDGIRLDMELDFNHPAYQDCASLYKNLSGRTNTVFLSDQDSLISALENTVRSAAISTRVCHSPELTVIEKQLQCESEVVINPPGKVIVSGMEDDFVKECQTEDPLPCPGIMKNADQMLPIV